MSESEHIVNTKFMVSVINVFSSNFSATRVLNRQLTASKHYHCLQGSAFILHLPCSTLELAVSPRSASSLEGVWNGGIQKPVLVPRCAH